MYDEQSAGPGADFYESLPPAPDRGKDHETATATASGSRKREPVQALCRICLSPLEPGKAEYCRNGSCKTFANFEAALLRAMVGIDWKTVPPAQRKRLRSDLTRLVNVIPPATMPERGGMGKFIAANGGK